jgi:hypothetical protein
VIREKKIRAEESSRKSPILLQRKNEKRNKTRRIINPSSGGDLNPASSISGLQAMNARQEANMHKLALPSKVS